MDKSEYEGLDPLIIENIEYFKKHGHLSGPDPYEDFDGDIPEGCRACGGDYPFCRSGCSLFDD